MSVWAIPPGCAGVYVYDNAGGITLTQICDEGESMNPITQVTFCEMTAPSEDGGTCTDDSECVSIYVKDVDGNVVDCHPIYIDNREMGVTDANGYFSHTFINASTDTKHSLNICHCIITTGACNQQRIDIIVTPDPKKTECTELTVDCTS